MKMLDPGNIFLHVTSWTSYCFCQFFCSLLLYCVVCLSYTFTRNYFLFTFPLLKTCQKQLDKYSCFIYALFIVNHFFAAFRKAFSISIAIVGFNTENVRRVPIMNKSKDQIQIFRLLWLLDIIINKIYDCSVTDLYVSH